MNGDNAQIGRALARLIRAARADVMKGAMEPEDLDDIEQEYQNARRKFWAVIRKVTR